MPTEPRVRGRWFRVLKPQFAHEPLSGTGAQLMGGRYNLKGTPALYLSADPQTAYAEYTQNLYDRPGLMCSYDVDVSPAVDLTDSSVLSRYGISDAQLAGGWDRRTRLSRAGIVEAPDCRRDCRCGLPLITKERRKKHRDLAVAWRAHESNTSRPPERSTNKAGVNF